MFQIQKNNTENTEGKTPTEVIETSLPTSSTRVPNKTIPLQVPTKTVRSNSGIHQYPITSEMFASQDNTLDATFDQFQLQITATLPLSQYKGIQVNIPMCTPFTDYINQTQITKL